MLFLCFGEFSLAYSVSISAVDCLERPIPGRHLQAVLDDRVSVNGRRRQKSAATPSTKTRSSMTLLYVSEPLTMPEVDAVDTTLAVRSRLSTKLHNKNVSYVRLYFRFFYLLNKIN